jgi:hypothetical protein
MQKPNNNKIKIRRFKFRVTRWDSLDAIADINYRYSYTTITDNFNDDPFYGIDYILKFNVLKNKYAAYVKDRRITTRIKAVEIIEERAGLMSVMDIFKKIVK